MKIKRLFVSAISIVIGCLQKKMRLKNSPNWLTCFSLNNLLKNQHEFTCQTRTLIDLVFSNRPETIIKSGVDHVGMSDHSLVYVHRKISIPRKQPKIIDTRQFKHHNV